MPESPEESSQPSATPEQQASPSDGSDGRTTGGLQRKFVDTLGWLITGAWAASFLLDAAIRDYDPPVSVHALMMVVAGAAFGSSLIHRGD